MKKNVKIIIIALIIIISHIAVCFGSNLEWRLSHNEETIATIEIGKSIYAGHPLTWANSFGGSDSTTILGWADKYELVYSGLEGNTLHFEYREYTMTKGGRPVLKDSLPLRYDLSKNKTIVYSGLKMDVLKYDSNAIEVKIIKHFQEMK